ncbi:MAG TPA: pantetheine-phosphate adenylyltransferase [Clostridiaceae bacterium]|nr:pantetheine-phosphate adenylyltransferase [Clostridiaceae bacterium]
MRIAVYPGSFDPLTLGHLDIILRGAKVFDKVIVAVLSNIQKNSLFTVEERLGMINKVLGKYDNIEVRSFEGLLVDFMEEAGAGIILKGLRAVSDFDYELQMAHINKELSKDVETVLMMTNPKYSYISSSNIKQIVHFNGDITNFVPEEILDEIYIKAERKRRK